MQCKANAKLTLVGDAEASDLEVLATGSAQLHVVAIVVVHAALGQHGEVLDFTLPQRKLIL